MKHSSFSVTITELAMETLVFGGITPQICKARVEKVLTSKA